MNFSDETTKKTISIPVTPMGKPRQTQRDRWAKRPVVERYHAYCDVIREALPDYELPKVLFIDFFLPMPESWSQKRRTATLGALHDQKPDIDNLVKGFIDAFKTEDKHVAVIHAEKYWSDEGSVDLRVTA